MAHSMPDTSEPLRFHDVHGKNIELLNKKTIAWRNGGFCHCIAFSHRPVEVKETVYIKLLETSTYWDGALRLGFTTNDPRRMKSKLPRYVFPDLVALPGNWAKVIPERLAKMDSILHFYVDRFGNVHYGVDYNDLGVLFDGVNTEGDLWAIVEVYGSSVKVEILNPFETSDDEDGSPEYGPILSFHPLSGCNIKLNDNRTEACRKKRNYRSHMYVFTNNPLKFDEVLSIKISSVDDSSSSSLAYGVTSCDPASLSADDLPTNPFDLRRWADYWFVKKDSNRYKAGATIDYCLCRDFGLMVMVNGELMESDSVKITQPLWLYFNLTESVRAITLKVKKNESESINEVSEQFKNLTSPSRASKEANQATSSSKDKKNQCVICCDAEVNCVMYRCGHMCTCYDCAFILWRPGSGVVCPLCREVIEDVIKIFR